MIVLTAFAFTAAGVVESAFVAEVGAGVWQALEKISKKMLRFFMICKELGCR